MKHALVRSAHALLAFTGFLFWAVGTTALVVTTFIAVIGHRLWPDADMGNCWTYALPRFADRGGYLLVRPADGQKFLGMTVPHVIFVASLPKDGVELEQFVPLKRHRSKWFPWYTVYYKGKVIVQERPHPANKL